MSPSGLTWLANALSIRFHIDPYPSIKEILVIPKMKKPAVLSALLTFGLAAVLSSCGPSQADLDKAIGDYLAKNPQALQKPIQEALKKQMPQRKPELPLEERIKNAVKVDLNNAPTKGPENAPITIVEFSDFQCPFCARVLPNIDQVMKANEGKVRLAFRQHPLSFHQNAMSAAKAALAANEQGKFWQLHDLLFANQKDLSDESIKKLAQQAGLNMSKFEAAWKSNKFDAQIEADIKFATSNGATGTPAFFINGVLLSGAQPAPAFQAVIDKLLEQKK